MDTTILVEELDRSAIKLVNALNDKGFDFSVAALMKSQDTEDWYIVFGIPELQTKGSRDFFVIIYNTIKENELNLSLSDIKLLDARSLTFQFLKEVINTGSQIKRIVYTGNYIHGNRFPDSIIYRAV